MPPKNCVAQTPVKTSKKKRQRNKKPKNSIGIPVKPMAVPQTMVRAQTSVLKSTQNPITLGFALPHLFPTPRFSDVFTGAPTAIANPFAVVNADWTSPDGSANFAIPKGSYFAAVSRSPLSHSIEWKLLDATKSSIYDFYGPTPTSATPFSNRFRIEVGGSIIGDNSNNNPLSPHFSIARHWGDSLYNHIHGYKYFCVDAGELKGVWVDADVVAGVSFFSFVVDLPCDTLGTTNRGAFVRCYVWNGDGWNIAGDTPVFQPGTLGSSAAFQPNISGYYAFSVISNITYTTANPVNHFFLTFSQTLKGSGFGFSPLPKIEEMTQNVDGIRVSGVSIMLSPHPSAFNLGGEVAGVQLPPADSWHSVVNTKDIISVVTNLQTAYTGKLKNGIYGFMKPTSTADFAMTEPFIMIDSVVSAYYNPIQPPGGWLVVVAAVGANSTGGSSTYPGGLAYLTLASGVEYRTTNVWLSVQPPSDDPLMFERGIAALRGVAQWHENPFHIKDIMKSVFSAGKTALRLAPSIANLVAQFVPGVNPSKALLGSLAALGRAV